MAFYIYPDQIDFMQWLPVSPSQTLIREIAYAMPDERREMRAARYLNWRINRQVNAEDTDLLERVQAGLGSKSFSVGPLSKDEVALRHYCARIRRVLHEASGDKVSRLRPKRTEGSGWGTPSPGPLPEEGGEMNAI
jgi:phenylpropionate dioxygenase-like ring-hydroxylating dioxygenase large terminal subunit